MRTRKSVRELEIADVIQLPGGTVLVIHERPVIESKKGWAFVPCTIPGMKFMQVLKFDWREEFDVER